MVIFIVIGWSGHGFRRRETESMKQEKEEKSVIPSSPSSSDDAKTNKEDSALIPSSDIVVV